MTKYLTVTEVAARLRVNPKRAANLLSENGIKAIRVYPADKVAQVHPPGQGARTDLKGSDMLTDRDIRDQVKQVTDTCVGTYDVDALTAALIARHGRVSIEDLDADEFWALVWEHATD